MACLVVERGERRPPDPAFGPASLLMLPPHWGDRAVLVALALILLTGRRRRRAGPSSALAAPGVGRPALATRRKGSAASTRAAAARPERTGLRRSGIRPARRVTAARVATSLAIAAAGAAIALLLTQRPVTEPRREPTATAPIAAAPAQPTATAKPAGATPVQVPANAPSEPYTIEWPFEIADGITFGPESAIRTRLAGLDAPARDAICSDRDGRPWACGLQARAALNNVTRRQTLTCRPAGGASADPILARCTGGVDVAKEMVSAGFARPSTRDPVLEAAEDEARSAERGLWNGGWSIRQAIR